jgi:hypothetical protein
LQTDKNLERIYRMTFASVYPHYIAKAEKKGRTKAEVDALIDWLTGYKGELLQAVLDEKRDFQSFFENAPAWNPRSSRITGTICGYRVEDIQDPILQKVRYLDKIIDELAKGKTMEKIMRA